MDKDSWSHADANKCADSKTDEACAGVKAYLQTLPEGRHATEAKEPKLPDF